MHRKVVVAIGLGLFFEVYEIFLSCTIATALKTQYGLGGSALELLLASSFLGHVHRSGRVRSSRRPDRAPIAAFAPNPCVNDGPNLETTRSKSRPRGRDYCAVLSALAEGKVSIPVSLSR
jgi:hypothetical protein